MRPTHINRGRTSQAKEMTSDQHVLHIQEAAKKAVQLSGIEQGEEIKERQRQDG